MGWNTQISIIVEDIGCEYLDIAEQIYTKDAKSYWGNGFNNILFTKSSLDYKLFITYNRRKYMPYWVIQDISYIYKHAYFTIIAESPEFILGPSGIVRITNGKIIDSYGFSDELRSNIVNDSPNIYAIINWFNKKGQEEYIRQKAEYISKQPMKWIQEDFMNNLLDFDENELLELKKLIVESTQKRLLNWTEIPS